jgi:hypothetical protein
LSYELHLHYIFLKMEDRFAGKREAKQIQTSLVKIRGKIVSHSDTGKTAHFVRWEEGRIKDRGTKDDRHALGVTRKMDEGWNNIPLPRLKIKPFPP